MRTPSCLAGMEGRSAGLWRDREMEREPRDFQAWGPPSHLTTMEAGVIYETIKSQIIATKLALVARNALGLDGNILVVYRTEGRATGKLSWARRTLSYFSFHCVVPV